MWAYVGDSLDLTLAQKFPISAAAADDEATTARPLGTAGGIRIQLPASYKVFILGEVRHQVQQPATLSHLLSQITVETTVYNHSRWITLGASRSSPMQFPQQSAECHLVRSTSGDWAPMLVCGGAATRQGHARDRRRASRQQERCGRRKASSSSKILCILLPDSKDYCHAKY
ncbi:hypothetical protein OsI_38165 [Oryza sativa Indica Group]|uniref:Uncharacterized protein n=1 Tax=Oryza sativa subsp. indica TaxID=39946 RepID=B8BPD6_ORYSI|nr:hypothetical protein OsI_38165 [Oryza sativa Indica Group]